MKISKLKIENLYGIEELELGDKSVELTGSNGVGKSSVIDAIRLALTNNSKRKYIVKNGEREGRIYVKLDDGITIDRKKRTDKSDYKSIKDVNGNEINSPEAFLKDIFTPLQLEPVEFLNMSEQEQNRILLNLIDFKEDKTEFIKKNFGELPSWVNYNDSILEILNQIQSKDGEYYQNREEINRNIRNGLAIIKDIAKDIPENYDADKWKNYTLSDKYEELNKKKDHNNKIDRSIDYKSNYDNTIKGYKGELDSELANIKSIKEARKKRLEDSIIQLKNQIALYEKDLQNLDNEFLLEENKAQAKYNEEVAKLEENIKIANEWIAKEKEDTDTLENELKLAEEMKGHLNEYDRMISMQANVDSLNSQSEELTKKIELARELPGKILKEANIPVKNLTVENGIPLVNGLPINGLSEGEKLDLCIDVTLAKENTLKLILIDGIERMSDANKQKIYEKCKNCGVQVISTRTTNEDTLTIIEL